MKLLSEKAQLSDKKLQVVNDIATIKSEMHSQKHGHKKWQELNRMLNEKKHELNSLESRLINIKQLLREEAAEKVADVKQQPDLMHEIIALRNEYEAFGADATRVSSMRMMASEFAVKLTRLIKHH